MRLTGNGMARAKRKKQPATLSAPWDGCHRPNHQTVHLTKRKSKSLSKKTHSQCGSKRTQLTLPLLQMIFIGRVSSLLCELSMVFYVYSFFVGCCVGWSASLFSSSFLLTPQKNTLSQTGNHSSVNWTGEWVNAKVPSSVVSFFTRGISPRQKDIRMETLPPTTRYDCVPALNCVLASENCFAMSCRCHRFDFHFSAPAFGVFVFGVPIGNPFSLLLFFSCFPKVSCTLFLRLSAQAFC